jgi:hypothetical protein
MSTRRSKAVRRAARGGVVAGVLLVACSGPPDTTAPDAPPPGPTPTNVPPTFPSIAASPGTAALRCSDGAPPPAYLWAADGTLFAFDVATLAKTPLGVP